MKILQGYENSYSNEKNSVSIKIKIDLDLNIYLKNAIKKVDTLYNIMSDFTKKYKEIIFYHTFRLGHNDKDYLKNVTRSQNVLYEKSPKYTADGDNLKYQLQKSLNFLVNELKNLGDSGWYGDHFINIMMKNNDTIVHVEDDERQKIRKTNKKTSEYAFIDDNDTIAKAKVDERQKIKKKKNQKTSEYAFIDDIDIVEPSAEKNSRFNNSMIQSGGGYQLKKSNHILMDKTNLENLRKSDLINLILKLQKSKNVVADDAQPSPKTRRPVPTPRKSVKDMVKEYEDIIILPPPKFRDDHKPIPLPRTKKPSQAPIPTPRTKKPSEKPVPEKRTIISQVEKALKGYTQSFDVELRDKKDPLLQLQKSRKAVEYLFNNLLVKTKGFKFVETLQVKFVKYSDGKPIQKNGYFNSTTDLIINKTDIKLAIQASHQQILNKIAQWISEGSGWTIQLIENHYINIVNYNPLKGSSYIKLPQELKNRGLINLQNEDNECFRWCHIRHLNPQGKDPQRIKKTDKTFICQLDYSSIEFPVTVKQINKIEKQNNICINLFGYEEKQPFPIYISKEKYQDHMELLLITEGENKHYVLIKDFNKFMFSQTKHEHKKYFCMYCLQCFSREDVLTEHKNNCISINGKQAINMPEKGDKVYFKNHHKQLPVPFVIYADLKLSQKKYKDVSQTMKNHTQKLIKNTQIVDMGIRSSVVMMTNTVNHYRSTEVKMLFINSWRIC